MISRHPRSVAVMALLWMAAADANGLDNWYRILIGGQDAGEMHVVVTAAEGVTTCIEVGPGNVLAGLIRRIDRDLTALAIGDPESLAKAQEVLHG